MLALVGAVGSAAYFLIGRQVRRQMSNASYIGIVYPACAVALLAAARGDRHADDRIRLRSRYRNDRC